MRSGDGVDCNGIPAWQMGSVTSIEGSKVHLELSGQGGRPDVRVTVGNFVRIQAGVAVLIGIITTLSSGSDRGRQPGAYASLDLLGEIVSEDGAKHFQRGVTCYPAIGDAVDLLPPDDLRVVYQVSGSDTASVGALYQDPGIPACIKVEDLLTKHFAVLGSTGVGKSSGVAVILDQVLRARQMVRIFLLDVHNEYAACFGDRATLISPRNLKLPFWLFNLEEIADVIYGGRSPVDEEIEILAEVIPLAKSKYAQYKEVSDRQIVKRGDRQERGLHGRHPGPLRAAGPDLAHRRADGAPGEPRLADALPPPDHPDRGDPQRSPLRLHVRERQCRRRHDGRDPGAPVPARSGRAADDDHAAGRAAHGGGRRRRVRPVPPRLRVRHLERGRDPAAVRVRGGASLRVRRPLDRLHADAPRPVADRPRRPQARRPPRPGDAAARPNSTRPSCPSAAPCSPCG